MKPTLIGDYEFNGYRYTIQNTTVCNVASKNLLETWISAYVFPKYFHVWNKEKVKKLHVFGNVSFVGIMQFPESQNNNRFVLGFDTCRIGESLVDVGQQCEMLIVQVQKVEADEDDKK